MPANLYKYQIQDGHHDHVTWLHKLCFSDISTILNDTLNIIKLWHLFLVLNEFSKTSYFFNKNLETHLVMGGKNAPYRWSTKC